MPFARYLRYTLPLMRGEDVLEIQQRLLDLGYVEVGEPDGLFGRRTDAAVREFQQRNGLEVDGIVGPRTYEALFEEPVDRSIQRLRQFLPELTTFHRYRDSIAWRVQRLGVEIENVGIEQFSRPPKSHRRVWEHYGASIEKWSNRFGLPAELIVATICTESNGKADASREEPGYVSDDETPNKVSLGLMQTLISTARAALNDPAIDRAWLLDPDNSIQAGTAYMAQMWKSTHFDPPKVACGYNAGAVRYNDSPNNRWKMRQYPIGTSKHADRFVKWFNACCALFVEEEIRLPISFVTAA
jgi:soluble lytic murein transglycosylase-like protein